MAVHFSELVTWDQGITRHSLQHIAVAVQCGTNWGSQDSRRRKKEQRAEVESPHQPSVPSMAEEDLRQTGLRRWPDYGFLCGDEAGEVPTLEHPLSVSLYVSLSVCLSRL